MAIANSDGSIVLSLKISTQKAIGKLKGDLAKVAESKNAFSILSNRSKQLQTELKSLEKEYAILISQEKALAVDEKYEAKLKILGSSIRNVKRELEYVNSALSALGKKATKSVDDMSKGFKNFGKRIAGILKSALIFSVLYRIMQSVVKLFNNILMSDEEFRQDWEELKAAFYTAAYPIINLIVPAIKYIVQQVRNWAVSIGKVAAALQGMSYSELVDQAKASKEAADSYADMEKSSKKTADNVKKQLASFDDIQILSSGKEEEQGIGASGFEGLKEYDTSGEKSMLNDLMNALAGALAAVGLVLLFNGQIGWGIGFIVTGASFWAISEIWNKDYDPSNIYETINNIMATLGVSLAAVGIILLLKGITGWGIGFLIGGAAFWAVSEIWGEDDDLSNASVVVENIMQTISVSLAAVGLILLTKGIWTWGIGFIAAGATFWAITEFATSEFSTDPVENALIKIMGILGTVLAALGILLCIFGGPAALPWGIGFIIAGAVAFVSAVAINSDAVVEAIRGPLGVITAIAGAALLVLGIILACTGNLILGIPLIALGAAALVTPIALNWDYIVEQMRGTFGKIMAIASGALLVLGILLCFVPGAQGIALGLILAGVAGLATVAAFNSDAIVDWVEGAWEAVEGFWDKYIAPVFTAKFWLDLAKTCGNGLIGGFESAVNGIIWLFEKMINFVVDGLNVFLRGVDSVISAVGSVFGQDWSVATIPSANLGRVSIPRLAQGAVIPPNREFLAVLGDQKHGTNIEAPLQTIVDAFNIALQGNANYGGNTEVVLEIDGREFGRAVVEQGNRENRRIGTRLVIA